MSVVYRFDLAGLFMAARMNPKNPMNEPGRLTGRYCKARLQRAQAKRLKGRVKAGRRGKPMAKYSP